MTLRFAVVHEAEADFHTATELADRVLVEAIDWLDEDHLVHQREWLAATAEGRRLTWTGLRRLAEDAGIEAEGFFDGQPGLPDARAARRAILYLLETFPDINGIVLIRDQDDQPERQVGLEQARRENHHRAVIVVGLAIVERETWVISGFDPNNDSETALLVEEQQNLGFDPRIKSHQLTAGKDDHAKRSPKRVLRVLCAGNEDRERRCWQETSLPTLRERSEENGLTAYLEEVREKLASQIGHTS